TRRSRSLWNSPSAPHDLHMSVVPPKRTRMICSRQARSLGKREKNSRTEKSGDAEGDFFATPLQSRCSTWVKGIIVAMSTIIRLFGDFLDGANCAMNRFQLRGTYRESGGPHDS